MRRDDDKKYRTIFQILYAAIRNGKPMPNVRDLWLIEK